MSLVIKQEAICSNTIAMHAWRWRLTTMHDTGLANVQALLHAALAPHKLMQRHSFAGRTPRHAAAPPPSPSAFSDASSGAQLSRSPGTITRLRRRMLSWLPMPPRVAQAHGRGDAHSDSGAASRHLARAVSPPPRRAPRRVFVRSCQTSLTRRVQDACAEASLAVLPAAEAVVLLVSEVQQQRHPAVVMLTAASIWLVLLASELRIVSQWGVAMLAYTLAFATPLLFAKHADALAEVCHGAAVAGRWISGPGQRARACGVVALGSTIVCGMGGALVPRLTVAAAAVAASVAWQLSARAGRCD